MGTCYHNFSLYRRSSSLCNFTVLVSLSADISGLLESQPLPQSAVRADVNLMKAAEQDAPRGAPNNAIVVTAVAGSVAAAIVVVAVLITRRRERRMQQKDEAVIMQDMPGFMGVSLSCHLHH